jgi:hypothetical protein
MKGRYLRNGNCPYNWVRINLVLKTSRRMVSLVRVTPKDPPKAVALITSYEEEGESQPEVKGNNDELTTVRLVIILDISTTAEPFPPIILAFRTSSKS